MYTPAGLCATFISFLGFFKLNQWLNSELCFIPVPAKYAGSTRYKWSNAVGSFIHATLVSLLGAYCMYQTPEYFTERVLTTTTLGEIIIGIFAGYFIFDSVDLVKYQGIQATWPVVLHHVVLVSVGLGYFLYHHQLVGYGMLACLIEINSIFLHGRLLLLMYGFSKTSLVYRLNSVFNIITYLAFRMGCLVLLIPMVMDDCERISSFWCYWFRVTAVTLLVINLILFYRLIRSDFITKSNKGIETDLNIMVPNNNNLNGKSH
ncbi:TLC domain-containing protein 2-like [Amphiura filiformis]|uniref:TLC domain-containing protein 2-like n=1 Tax=Amphiura filiformis TaxID=82378 RepID=UPI003B215CF6